MASAITSAPWVEVVLSVLPMDALLALFVGFAAGGGWLQDATFAHHGREVQDEARSGLGTDPAPANRLQRRIKAAQDRRKVQKFTPPAILEARRAAREIGALVWSAKDAADLSDILDAGVGEQERSNKVASALFSERFTEFPTFGSFVAAISAKVDGIAPQLFEGMRAVATVAQRLSDALQSPATDVGRTFEDEYDLPAPILRAIIAMSRSTTSLAALADLAMSKSKDVPPKWLVRQVVREWVDGARSLLGAIAMFTGEDMPEDMLPRSQRLDHEQLVKIHNEEEAVFEQFFKSAAANRS